MIVTGVSLRFVYACDCKEECSAPWWVQLIACLSNFGGAHLTYTLRQSLLLAGKLAVRACHLQGSDNTDTRRKQAGECTSLPEV